jgi:hypothetical protein
MCSDSHRFDQVIRENVRPGAQVSKSAYPTVRALPPYEPWALFEPYARKAHGNPTFRHIRGEADPKADPWNQGEAKPHGSPWIQDAQKAAGSKGKGGSGYQGGESRSFAWPREFLKRRGER